MLANVNFCFSLASFFTSKTYLFDSVMISYSERKLLENFKHRERIFKILSLYLIVTEIKSIVEHHNFILGCLKFGHIGNSSIERHQLLSVHYDLSVRFDTRL